MGHRAPEIIVDPRAEGLIVDIGEIVAKENPDVIRERLNGIIGTFEEKAWARPAVEEARRQLQALEATIGPSRAAAAANEAESG